MQPLVQVPTKLAATNRGATTTALPGIVAENRAEAHAASMSQFDPKALMAEVSAEAAAESKALEGIDMAAYSASPLDTPIEVIGTIAFRSRYTCQLLNPQTTNHKPQTSTFAPQTTPRNPVHQYSRDFVRSNSSTVAETGSFKGSGSGKSKIGGRRGTMKYRRAIVKQRDVAMDVVTERAVAFSNLRKKKNWGKVGGLLQASKAFYFGSKKDAASLFASPSPEKRGLPGISVGITRHRFVSV